MKRESTQTETVRSISTFPTYEKTPNNVCLCTGVSIRAPVVYRGVPPSLESEVMSSERKLKDRWEFESDGKNGSRSTID